MFFSRLTVVICVERAILQMDVQRSHGQHLWLHSGWTAEPEEVRHSSAPRWQSLINNQSILTSVCFPFSVVPAGRSVLIRTPLMPPPLVLLRPAPPITSGKRPSLSILSLSSSSAPTAQSQTAVWAFCKMDIVSLTDRTNQTFQTFEHQSRTG